MRTFVSAAALAVTMTLVSPVYAQNCNHDPVCQAKRDGVSVAEVNTMRAALFQRIAVTCSSSDRRRVVDVGCVMTLEKQESATSRM